MLANLNKIGKFEGTSPVVISALERLDFHNNDIYLGLRNQSASFQKHFVPLRVPFTNCAGTKCDAFFVNGRPMRNNAHVFYKKLESGHSTKSFLISYEILSILVLKVSFLNAGLSANYQCGR